MQIYVPLDDEQEVFPLTTRSVDFGNGIEWCVLEVATA